MCLRVKTCRCIMVLHVTPESFEQWRVTKNSHGARVWLYFTGHVNYAGHAPLTYSMWFYCHPEVWHQGMLSCRRRVRPDVYVAIIKSGFCSFGRLFWPRFLKEDQDLMFLSHVNSVLTGFSHTEERGRRRKKKQTLLNNLQPYSNSEGLYRVSGKYFMIEAVQGFSEAVLLFFSCSRLRKHRNIAADVAMVWHECSRRPFIHVNAAIFFLARSQWYLQHLT